MKKKLKTIGQLSCTGLALALVLSSCTMEKRAYRSGYHLEWNKHRHDPSKQAQVSNEHSNQDQVEEEVSLQSVNDTIQEPSSVVADDNITASIDPVPVLLKKINSPVKQVDTLTDKKNLISVPTVLSKKNQMKTEKQIQSNDTLKTQKTVLSTLWTFVTLNYLYCDLAGLMDATVLSQYLAGVVGGFVISQGFLLAAGILMEIPISMVLFSRILKGKGNRNANIAAGIIMTAVQVATLFAGPVTLYYLFFSVIEIAATAFITWYAWKKLPKKQKLPVAES